MPSAQVTITQLPQAGPITGTESVPIVQNGQTVQTTTGAIAASPSQNQTFVTVNQEPTLPNSRALSGSNGVGLTDGGALSTLQITLNGASGSLESSNNGIIAKTGGATVTGRTLQASGAGLAVTNGNGVSGNPTYALTGLAASLANISGTGVLGVIGGSSITSFVITGTNNQIDVANGAGPGNPTISISSNPIIPGTGAMTVPVGTTAQQPGGSNGQIRYNTTTQTFDGYQDGSWRQFSLTGGVTTFSAGTTGFTPVTPTAGAVVLGGILVPANGGTGVNNGTYTITLGGNLLTAGEFTTSGAFPLTLVATDSTSVTLPTTGTLATLAGAETLTNKTINGSSNTLSNIANASLVNSSVTYNGVTVALGASGTITAATTAALTVSTGLQLNSGTTFDGSVAKTITIDGTVVTLSGTQTLTNKTLTLPVIAQISNTGVLTLPTSTDTLVGRATTDTLTNKTLTTPIIAQIVNTGTLTLPTSTDTLVGRATTDTLTNKTIDGGTNTLQNIPNAALTNSSITVGTTAIALGASSLTLGGLTSVAVTQDPTTALQLATKQYVDTLVSSGITYHTPVKYEVPNSTGNLNATYNQPGGPGVGVGATLTNAGTKAAFAPDGPTASIGDRILIYNQTNQFENGIYEVSVVGTPDPGGTNWVLTRTSDADTYALKSINGLGNGDAFFITSGNTGAGETYVCNTVGTITFGTTAITFAQISSSQVYSAGTGLTLTGTQFSITNTGVAAATYGSASQVPVLAVNAQGQITSVTNTSIAIDGNQITTGTVAVTVGGTGLSSGTSGGVLYFSGGTTLASSGVLAANALVIGGGAGVAPSTITTGTGVTTALGISVGTAGAFVVNGGALGTPLSGTLTNATGLPLSTGVTGTLAVANGGTGQSSYLNGELLIGNTTGNTLTKATLTAGSGVSISNGSGSITISATGLGGTVTSVDQTFTGGLISVSGNPITTSGTLALTVAGTSGGIVYFSSSSTWASSAALAANAIVIGGGAGVAPSTTATGTGVLTALGINVGTAGAFVVNGGALGTPSSGTLTNATGLPISTGVSGLGTGVATFLATPSSANLAAAVTDETGSGALVFGTSPTLATPTITTAATFNAQGEARFADSDSSNYVGFKAPATVNSNLIWTLPATDGSGGQVLSTDGAGTLQWSAGGGASSIITENAQTISSNYTLSSGSNGQSIGPVTVSTGVSVTVGTGQKWVIWGF